VFDLQIEKFCAVVGVAPSPAAEPHQQPNLQNDWVVGEVS